ncbi:MAG: hypothetical protein K2L33_07895 [Muribaculaceae bacterium]|nr:hypothetical protein [Muribaculaceae bacterium]
MTDNAAIERWMAGDAPTADEVAALEATMPWWLLPAVLRLRNAATDMTDDERSHLRARLAVGASDPEQMAMAADSDLAIDLARFYPVERPSTPDTAGTIEKFLTTYGTSDSAENELLERLIFNPTPDYAQILSREEEQSIPQEDEAPAGTQDALINSFIIKSKANGGQFPATADEAASAPAPAPQSQVQKPSAADDSMLSESLAMVYIKRGKYSKAHEIISHLNLNFPEKSIYFADQLRFLEKLMAIEERKSASINENNN